MLAGAAKGRKDVRVGRRRVKLTDIYIYIYCETVWIEVQVGVPFQIGDRHGWGWSQGVCV